MESFAYCGMTMWSLDVFKYIPLTFKGNENAFCFSTILLNLSLHCELMFSSLEIFSLL